MNDDYYQRINLAGLTVDIYTDNSFRNIRGFLDRFTNNNHGGDKDQKVKIFFSRATKK